PRACADTLSLHDALPIWPGLSTHRQPALVRGRPHAGQPVGPCGAGAAQPLRSHHQVTLMRVSFRPAVASDIAFCESLSRANMERSEEHTSELQSRENLVC